MEKHLDCAGALTGAACGACYVCSMVAVFEAVKRVLRDDGTCWLNLGDSYAGSGKGFGGTDHGKLGPHANSFLPPPSAVQGRLKPKDLCGVPWRVALALQASGWYLRQDIAWVKTAPMPESVRDRFTSSWEHIFLLTKAPRYFFDVDALREPSVSGHSSGNGFERPAGISHHVRGQPGEWREQPTRQMRNSWVLNPEPYAGEHFAVFPTELVRRCLLAGSPVQCCAACGAGWRRVVERYRTHNGVRRDDLGAWRNTDPGSPLGAQGDGHARYATVRITHGFRPACACDAPAVPATILDPFVGSGTVPLVALQHGRASIGVDLNRQYVDLARQRLTPAMAQLPLFAFLETMVLSHHGSALDV